MLRKDQRKFILMILAFVLPFIVISTLQINADDPSDYLHLNKEATYNPDTHQIDYVLSSYSTGLITHSNKVVPTDLVLVLDQSGSMDESFGRGTKLIKNGSNAPRYRDLYSTRNNIYFYNENKVFEKVTITRSGDNQSSSVHTLTLASGEILESGVGSTQANRPYYQIDVAVKRIDALVSAVSVLVTDTYRNAELHGVEHRISILGFSNGANSYNGTQILTTTTGSDINYKPENADASFENHLMTSLMDVSTTQNQAYVRRAIYSISTFSSTYTTLGVEMGRRVLDKHPVSNQERVQAMIVFTDGQPNGDHTGQTDFANGATSAIFEAKRVKDKGSHVYSVAIYEGTDPATIVTNTPFVFLSGVNKVNKFLHYLSSNYNDVVSVYQDRAASDNGYYKVANSADELINIFESISKTEMTPSINLDRSASLVDVVSPEFYLSLDTIVDVYTQDYLGGDPENEANWGELNVLDDAIVNVEDDGISVTNYDYATNYILVSNEAETPAKYGNRLVVKFSADIKPGFLGGNEIVTNTVESGIYNPNAVPNKVKSFELPEVDVPSNIEFTVNDLDIYLGNEILFEDLVLNENGLATYTMDGVTYEVDGINNKYVNLTYLITDSDGNNVRVVGIMAGTTNPIIVDNSLDFDTRVTNDTSFTHSIGLEPVIFGSFMAFDKHAESNVKVFKPHINTIDDEIYLGTQYDPSDKVSVAKWCHYANCDTSTIPAHYDEPTLTYTLELISGSEPNGMNAYYPEFDSKFKVNVAVGDLDITEHTTFNYQSVTDGMKVDLLYKDLIIEKVLPKQLDDNQAFMFDVKFNQPDYLSHFVNTYGAQVTIVGEGMVKISGLPVGSYTISEDESWSWRYEVEGDSVQNLNIDVDSEDLKVIFKNVIKDDKWLSDEEIITNIFR